MKKRVIAAVVIMAGFLLPALSVSAESDSANPSIKDIKQMLTSEAREHHIPPEVVKAIASAETNYKQFDKNGDPIITDDGGIGIMQVTPDNTNLPDLQKDRLKSDIAYNIHMGVQVLDNKWNLNLPTINDHKRNILENWYLPVMAYNGLAKTNDPNLHPDDAYQEGVFARISGHSFIEQGEPYFITPTFEINYDDGHLMTFPDIAYKTYKTTPSQQMYDDGDTVYIDGRDGAVNLHQQTIDGPIKPLGHNTKLSITGEPIEVASDANDYIYYPVSGDDADGYVASAYLNAEKEQLPSFPDVSTKDQDHPQAIRYLAERNIISGYDDGTFEPHETITREQTVRMILKVMGRDFEHADPPDPGFSDVGDYAFSTVAEATRIGFISGKDDDTFKPYENLKRAQIAKIMVKAFDIEGSSDQTFTDVFTDSSAYDYINTLTANEIVGGYPDGRFEPWQDITRAQFAAILYRYLTE